MSRPDPLAAHVRRLGNHELNELLVQLPKPTFAALVEVALARPVLPAGLLLRYEPAPGVDGWTVVACAPRRRLGTLTRDRDPGGHLVWRAWTRAGDPVQVAGISLLAASRGRGRGPGLGHPGQPGPLPGPGRPCPRPGRPRAARAAAGAAPGGVRPAAGCGLRRRGDGGMTAVKRCPRCGQVKPAGEFYRRRRTRLSSYCRSCQRAAALAARRRRRQDPAAVERAAGGRPDPPAPPPPPGRPGPGRW